MTLEELRDEVKEILESKGYMVVNDEFRGIVEGIWSDVPYPMVCFSKSGLYFDAKVFIESKSYCLPDGEDTPYDSLESLKKNLGIPMTYLLAGILVYLASETIPTTELYQQWFHEATKILAVVLIFLGVMTWYL